MPLLLLDQDSLAAIPTSLAAALQQLEKRLDTWASNSEAYTALAPQGGERIYLNSTRQQTATAVVIEAAGDTTPPVAYTTNPAFATAATNPFGLVTVGAFASPSLVDIDRDGDLDAFIGNSNGTTLFFRNTAAAGSSTPAYAAAATNPFGLVTVGSFAKPSLVDIDRDGDLDAFIGNRDGNTLFFRNNAPAGSSNPAFATATPNPFGLVTVGFFASPSFVDIDRDGDLDAFIGSRDGNTLFFRNNAAAGSSNPAYAAAATNPFGLADVGSFASPSFVDIDGDGDLDAFIGDSYGNIHFFRNTASAVSTNPAYTIATSNPFNLADVGFYISPSLVDIDGDGDLDAFIGDGYGNTQFFRNTAPGLGVSSTSTNGTYGAGAVINLTVAFSEAVLVTGSPRLQLETGSTDRFATYSGGSGTSILTFSYSVQAGDTSGDLDVLAPNALSLNGGTIKDAAGNNAFLVLAAPGAPGSLGSRKNLVIFSGARVTGVSALTANGAYSTGAVITLTVAFSQAVVVSGIPRLQIETGKTDRFATYSAGSGTSTLSFSYTVQAGDSSADLDILNANALSLNGGSITDAVSGNNASLTLPAPGASGSLGANKNLVIDSMAPGAFSTVAFAIGVNNAFKLAAAGYSTNPTFVDIDGDADLDAFIGNREGNTLFFRNTATAGSSDPAFSIASTNPFGLADVGVAARPSLVDIDGDGDLDAFIGETFGDIRFFRNTAAAGSSNPAFAPAVTNPFNLGNVGFDSSPNFVDIDHDGDLDAFIDSRQGTFFFRNTATASSGDPAFSKDTTNPFGNPFGLTSPSFADIDDDGDLDAFIGNPEGNTLFLRNTAPANSTNPAFASAVTNPFNLKDVGGYARPSFVDIDRDGDLDAFIGNNSGNILFFRNTASVLGVNSTTPNSSYRIGAVISLTVTFSEAVFVTGIPNLQLETGSIDRFANYTTGSGTKTLTFSYTVQPGDSSDALDLISSNALALNGGTIRDAAGNNAVLRLAAPGAPGSLGSRKNLVIDRVAPVALTTAAFATALLSVKGGGGKDAPSTIPLGLDDVGAFASPSFVDIDGDGDLDAFIGNYAGNTLFFRNIAPAGSSTPFFIAATNPVNPGDVGSVANPSFADIDRDGDLDAFIGNGVGNTLFFRNTSAAGSTNPSFATAVTNPFNLGDVGYGAYPSFADIDGDGDLDAFIGEFDGNAFYFKNTAAAGSSMVGFADAIKNPFALKDVGNFASPRFADIDGDGDLDALVGNGLGNTLFFRNTGTAKAPAFAAASSNPFGLADVGDSARPSFVDIDADGDLDAFIGNREGNTLFFRNTAPLLGVSSTTTNGTYKVGAVISLTIAFSEAVLVTGAPRLQLETGTTDRFATYSAGSGTSILTFLYTVQAGDTSADLDVLSANALSLNTGTIKDTAGNTAVLTIAAPGAPGSLGSRKKLVIDGIAPTITAGPTVTGEQAISITANEAGIAALYKTTNVRFFPTALAANTPSTLNLAAQAAVTAFTLKVVDAAGNFTAATPGFRLGTIAADAITGSPTADFLYGFNANDNLNGGAGNDILTGGLGADNFRFSTALGTTNVDQITDFTLAQGDTIQLENAIFTGLLTPGTLEVSAFFIGAATTTSQRILYNSITGALAYDSDGSGGAAEVVFATMNTALLLTNASFTVT